MNTTEDKKEPVPGLTQAVATHRFISGMAPEYLEKLVSVAMFKEFKPDEIIFKESEPANRFYLITKGKVALESRVAGESAAPVQFLCEGDVLGWSWLFPPYYWHFSARAVEPTEAIFFYGTRLREECDDNPAFGFELLKRITGIVIKRLQITRVQMLEMQKK